MKSLKRLAALAVLLALVMSLVPVGSFALGIITSKVTITVSAQEMSAGRAVIRTDVKNPSGNSIKTAEYTLMNSAGKKLETVSRTVGKNSASLSLSFNTASFRTALAPNTRYTVEVNLVLKGLYRDVTKRLTFTTGTAPGISVSATSYKAGLKTGVKVSFTISNPSKNRIRSVSVALQGESQVTLNKTDAKVTASVSRTGFPGGKTLSGTATVTMATGQTYTKTFSVKTCESCEDRIGKFLSDKRWRNGTSWGTTAKSKMGGKGWAQCAAYAYDFAKYVFNRNPNSNPVSTEVNKTQNIRRGDVIKIKYKGGVHWFVVLERNGAKLKTADANWPVNNRRQVRVAEGNFEIDGNQIKVFKLKGGPATSTSVKVFHFYK